MRVGLRFGAPDRVNGSNQRRDKPNKWIVKCASMATEAILIVIPGGRRDSHRSLMQHENASEQEQRTRRHFMRTKTNVKAGYLPVAHRPRTA